MAHTTLLAASFGTKLIFLIPECLNVNNSFLSNISRKKNCVAIKKIKGNKSKNIDGEFRKVNPKGTIMLWSVSLKKFISSKMFITKTKEKNISETLKKTFKNFCKIRV